MKKDPCTWQITGINRLTGEREPITRALSYDMAIAIMDRERGRLRRAYLKLKAEKITPKQLTIKIEEL